MSTDYIEPGYGPDSKGATGNKGKQGAKNRNRNKAELDAKLDAQTRAIEEFRAKHVRENGQNPGKVTKLGQTEIRYDPDPYWCPIIKIGRRTLYNSSGIGNGKALTVQFYANGRAGKQVNWYALSGRRKGDQVEIDTQGATKSLITLEEWQKFIDAVPVQVADVSKNTVGPLTPELIKMARDVHAFRREEPTVKEWAEELKQSAATTKPTMIDIIDPFTGVVTQIAEAEYQECLKGYDANCGMQDKATWVRDFTVAAILSDRQVWLARLKTTTTAAPRPIAAMEQERIRALFAEPIIILHADMPLDPETAKALGAMTAAAVKAIREGKLGKPAVLPQDLQAASDAEKKPLRVIRNDTEMLNPRWEQDMISGREGLVYETDYGIPGKTPVTARLNSVTIERLIRTGGLVITGEMPEWVRKLIESPASPAERTVEAAPAKVDTARAELLSTYPVPQERIDRLFSEFEAAAKATEPDPITQLSDGFQLFSAPSGLTLRLQHKALPDWTFVVAARSFIDDRLQLKARPEDAQWALAMLKAANARKQAAAQAAAPQGTRVYKRREDGHMVEVQFIRWDVSGLVVRNGADHDVLFGWRELDEMGRKREIAIEGKMPQQALDLKHTPVYTRNLDLFVATRSGGGGFMKWDGNYLNLRTLVNLVVCAQCGCRIDNYKLSDVRADGFIENARYRTCGGPDRHVIRSAADVKWARGAQERHAKRKAAGKVKDVIDAYDWLKAKPAIDSEAVPF